MLTIHLTTSRKRSSTLTLAVNRVRTVHCVCGEPHLFTVIVSIQSGSNSLWSRLRKSYRGKYKSNARMLGHCILNFFFTATTMWLLINQKSRLDLWKPRGFYVVPTLLHSQPWNGQELRGLFLIFFPLFPAIFPIKFIYQKFLKGFYAWPSGIFSVPVDAISNRSEENIQEIIRFLLLQAEKSRDFKA